MNRLPVQLSLLIVIHPTSSSSSSVERSLRFGSAEGKAGCVNSLLPGLQEERRQHLTAPLVLRRTDDSSLCFCFQFYLHF